MADPITKRRKEQIQSCDFHLFTAIDRLFPLWAALYDQHPQQSYDLARMMLDIEQLRFRVSQFYKLLWGGNPRWMLKNIETATRMTEYRREVAWKEAMCQVSENDSETGASE